jgi:hypothetical protein
LQAGAWPDLGLIALEQQPFQRHPPHLPQFTLLFVHVQPAFALVIKGL